MTEHTTRIELIERYKSDAESVYNTWFVGSTERMKAFRAIRRAWRDTVDSIASGTFGNDFKGSPLEVVLTAITEQKQVFGGARLMRSSGSLNCASRTSTKMRKINDS